jgi:ATP-binding cassette subfamily B protein
MKEEKKKPATAGAVFRAYWHEIKYHPYYFAGVILFGIGGIATSLISPLFMRQFFNELQTLTPGNDTAGVLVGTLFLIALAWGFDWLFNHLERFSNQGLEARVMERLYTQSFEYLMRHSHNFFISNFAGSLVHKSSRYARAFETLFDTIVTQFFPTALFIIGATVILFIQNHVLGLILAVWDTLFILLQVYLSRLRQPIRTLRAAADTKLTGAISDSISNQSTVSLFAASGYESNQFAKVVGEWRAALVRSWTSDGWTQSLLSLFMTSLQVGVMFGAIIFWSRGLLTLGDFYLIQAYLLGTFNRLIGINFSLRRFYDGFTDAGEMVAILNTPHEIADKKGAKKLKVQDGEIWFDDASFHFNKDSLVLDHFNVTIKGGERVALVGPSGAGKSTVTKLLLRMYDLQEGEIKIDGQDITKVTQDSLREHISFVPQEPVLFHRTLKENIRYGRRDASDEEVIEAAKLAHCHEFISKLPLGYETLVGERGIKLSGGERQRVAIARAILKDAPILVLDEATSSLDSESEALIQDALETLMKGKTVVVIAHRLSTIMKMDRIIVMEGGTIAATGTHLELLQQEGLYKKLWSIQAGGFLVGDDEKTIENEAEEDGNIENSELAEA